MSLPTDSKARKERPIFSGVLNYFPDAIAEVAHVSYVGNQKHNPGQPLHWSRDKSSDHKDCIGRHLTEAGGVDGDGLRHSATLAWRALANLQLELEAEALGNVGPYGQQDYNDLIAMGCQPAVARLIVKGTTYPKDGLPPGAVYLSGPMRGYPAFNFPAFDEVRDRAVARGMAVISPADIDRAAGETSKEGNTATIEATDVWEYINRDFYAIRLIAKRRGHIVLLPGWENSKGALAEVTLARWGGVSALDSRDLLIVTPPDWCAGDAMTALDTYFLGA